MSADTWFTTERYDSETFAISEYGHREQTHSYLLLGRDRAALVDTGLGIDDIAPAVCSLTDLPITVITTHAHWDHIGGHGSFADIRVHPADRDWLENGIPIPLQQIRTAVDPAQFTRPAPSGFQAEAYIPFTGTPRALLNDGDSIDLGGRQLQIIHTPGHSPGHICVFEPERGYLMTGDLLYIGTLYAFYPSTDPVAFARSAWRIAALPGIRAVLPGHHSLEIPTSAVAELAEACRSLEDRGLLRHGAGTHEFRHFAVQF